MTNLHYYLCNECGNPFESWGSRSKDQRICLDCSNPHRRNFSYWEQQPNKGKQNEKTRKNANSI